MNEINVKIIGQIDKDCEFSHKTMNGMCFYKATVNSYRLSRTIDRVPLLFREEYKDVAKAGAIVEITGQVRSRNEIVGDRSKLRIYVNCTEIKALDIKPDDVSKDINDVEIYGHICKKQILRETPLKKVILDFLLAINYGKQSSYIPCIVWGRTAEFTNCLEVGAFVKLKGRFQSREYNKNDETLTAYEISVNDIQVIEEPGRNEDTRNYTKNNV